MTVENAAVAVVRVLAHADVPDQVEIRELPLRETEGLLHDAVLVTGGAPDGVLVSGDTEEHHGADAGFRHRLKFLGQMIEAHPVLPRHRRDLLADIRSLDHEHRIDQRRCVHPRFADHLPENRGSAEPSRPDCHIHCQKLLSIVKYGQTEKETCPPLLRSGYVSYLIWRRV